MKPKSPSILPVLLIAALAGGLTLFFLFSLHADTEVVIAARTIGVGARLTAEDLTVKQVRSADALPNALKSVDEAVGQVISVQRLAGDQITSDMLGSQALSAIASGLAPDHRAVAVKVSPSAGLAGIVRPGDLVTLIAVVEPPLSGQPSVFSPQPTVAPTFDPNALPTHFRLSIRISRQRQRLSSLIHLSLASRPQDSRCCWCRRRSVMRK